MKETDTNRKLENVQEEEEKSEEIKSSLSYRNQSSDDNSFNGFDGSLPKIKILEEKDA